MKQPNVKENKTQRQMMNSPCFREASDACFSGCCKAPFLNLVEFHGESPKFNKGSSTSTAPQYHFALCTISSLYPNTHFTTHESLPSLQESFAKFIEAYPQYSQTDLADQIRAKEYFHLTVSNHVCLDYIGHGIFSFNQLQREHSTTHDVASSSSSLSTKLGKTNTLLPYDFDFCYKSVNLKSQALLGNQGSELEFKMRKRIMDFMNISEVDYTMILTTNQSHAFKLLADSYPFHSKSNLLTVYDYKNDAVEAMIESSKKREARVISAEFSWPNMRILSRKLRKLIVSKRKVKQKGLFVFPLQSRLTGVRYSYQWMSIARENGWHVLLDACALGPKDMETLGLSMFKPDFLICSFFKVFGENPSGFGCLFAKKYIASELMDSTTTTNIGIVSLIPTNPQSHLPQESTIRDIETESKSKSQSLVEVFLPGPKSSSEIVDLEKVESTSSSRSEIECRGLDHADSLGLVLISIRARHLINWLVNALTNLKHPNSENGHSLIRIYGPKIRLDRGPSLAFNVFDWKGEKIDPVLVQKLADRNGISLSYGYLQNVLFLDKYEEERETKLEISAIKEAKGEFSTMRKRTEKNEFGICVVTITLGWMTNFEDVYRLWAFVSRFLDADFVEKEKWRYLALNQRTVEV